MSIAKAGFEVVWHREWPLVELSIRPPRAGALVTILKGERLPADHPVVKEHPGLFARD